MFILKDTEPSPLQDSSSVRRKGGLPGPPPVVPDPESIDAQAAYIGNGPFIIFFSFLLRKHFVNIKKQKKNQKKSGAVNDEAIFLFLGFIFCFKRKLNPYSPSRVCSTEEDIVRCIVVVLLEEYIAHKFNTGG